MPEHDPKDPAEGDRRTAELAGTVEPAMPADPEWASAGGQSLLRKSEEEMIARMDKRTKRLALRTKESPPAG